MFGRVSPEQPADAPATTERGWGKFLFAIAAFLIVPMIPQMRAVLPVEQTMVLLVPAIAACSLVGWWAGGRAFTAIAWVAIAALMTAQQPATPSAFYNLVRGWSLLLAGAFGLVCLFGARRTLFSRAMIALGITVVAATVMSLLGPVTPTQAAKTVSDEFARRNAETMTTLTTTIKQYPKEWAEWSTKVPALAQLPAQTATELAQLSTGGLVIFPALLALQSLAALALAWGVYHRLARSRIGDPLRPLRDFRFNDQLVWGLIIGLTVMLLPTLRALHGVGKNLLLFFGTLYAVRGLGVLTWFMAPGSLGVTLTVGFILLLAPVINVFAALAFMMLGVTSLALGLGDTWADWRKRARPTP